MTDLLFIHIPKTGGLSFIHSLGKAYGEAKEIWDFIPGHPEVLADMDSQFFWNHYWYRAQIRRAEDEASKHRIVYGHIPIWVFDGPMYFTPKVVWLRNPIDQILSRVFHFRKENLYGAQHYAPEDIVRWPAFQNNQFFYTGGDLSLFSYVGILERYDECHAEIAEMFEWPSHVQPVHTHVTDYEPELRQSLRENAAFCAELERMNAIDVALYDYALGMKGWK